MDRLSASGAIAGSKEPRTCRAHATPRRRPGNRPGGLRAVGSRAVASARRAAAFPVLCAMLAAPLLGAGGSAQAEELVSNLSSASSTAISLGTFAGLGKDAVQVFTSGTNPGGYTLTSIDLGLDAYAGGTTLPAVKVHNVTVTGTSVTLGTAVATLTTTLTVVDPGSMTFMAPMDTTLDPSTTYGVFAEGGGTGVRWDGVTTGDENDTPAAGWSIGDQVATRAHDATAGFHPRDRRAGHDPCQRRGHDQHRQRRPDGGDPHTGPDGDGGHGAQLCVSHQHVRRHGRRRHADLHGHPIRRFRSALVAELRRGHAHVLGHADGRGDSLGKGDGERRQWRLGQRTPSISWSRRRPTTPRRAPTRG